MRQHHARIAVDLALDPDAMKGFLGEALDGDLKPAIENGENCRLSIGRELMAPLDDRIGR
jgi:hypothetical protein